MFFYLTGIAEINPKYRLKIRLPAHRGLTFFRRPQPYNNFLAVA